MLQLDWFKIALIVRIKHETQSNSHETERWSPDEMIKWEKKKHLKFTSIDYSLDIKFVGATRIWCYVLVSVSWKSVLFKFSKLTKCSGTSEKRNRIAQHEMELTQFSDKANSELFAWFTWKLNYSPIATFHIQLINFLLVFTTWKAMLSKWNVWWMFWEN